MAEHHILTPIVRPSSSTSIRSHYLRNKRAEKVGADFIDDCGSIPTAPENITVTFLTPTSVRVSWQTSMDPHTMPVDKYDVTYKPTDASTPDMKAVYTSDNK
uniref:Fibronectin type-III domain-containing protein n=1 Tax=Anopheles merus TaxID=30066 RepID=A0A182VMN1_ANOME